MGTVFELSINAIECFIIIEFLTKYFGSKFEGNWRKPLFFLIAWVISFVELSYVNSLIPFDGIAIFIAAIMYFIYARISLKGHIFTQLFISVIIMAIIMVIGVSSIFIFGLVLKTDMLELIVNFNAIRILLVLTTKTLLFFITRIMLKSKKDSQMQLKEWIPLIVIPVISIVSISFLADATMKSSIIQNDVIYVTVCILITTVIIYYLFTQLSSEYQLKSQHLLLQQQYNYERKQVEDIQLAYQNMKELRHEMKNHFLALSVLLTENRQCDAQVYIDKIIDGQLAEKEKLVFTENEVLNAVVGTRLAICAKKEIQAEAKITHSLKNMSDEDISVLLGNLLDNAIEASENLTSKNLKLEIQPQGEYVSIFMTNSICSSVLANNPELSTTKHEKFLHGFGIKNIKNIVEKYNGMIDYFEEDNTFCCDILIEKLPTLH